jgi:hypothetical protein
VVLRSTGKSHSKQRFAMIPMMSEAVFVLRPVLAVAVRSGAESLSGAMTAALSFYLEYLISNSSFSAAANGPLMPMAIWKLSLGNNA